MPQTPAHITVDPLGYTLSVTITPPGSTLVLSRRDGSSTYDVVSMPTTISAPTNFWLTDGGINVTVSLKLDAHEVAADSGVAQVVSVPASGGKAIRPSADALRTATSALTPAAASAAYALLPPSAWAHQHVSPTGLDTNDGRTPAAPKLTMQAAHDALPSTGGVLQLAPGTFTDSLVITKSYTVVQGSGPWTTKIAPTGAGAIGIHVNGSSGANVNNVTIRDVGFQGNGTQVGIQGDYWTMGTFENIYYRSLAGLFRIINSTYIHGTRVITDSNRDYCGYWYGSANCVLTQASISGPKATNLRGFTIDSGCDGVEMSHVNINNAGYGVVISHSDSGTHRPYSTILTAVQAGNGANNGFELDSGVGTQLTACIAVTMDGDGYYIHSSYGATLTNCRSMDNGRNGVIADSDNWTWIGGEVGGNSKSASGTYDGIRASACGHFVISGVRAGAYADLGNTQKYGVNITAGCTNYHVGPVDCEANLTGPVIDSAKATSGFVSTDGPEPRLQSLLNGNPSIRTPFARWFATSTLTLTSGVMLMVALPLQAGDVVSNLTFVAAATALTMGSNADGHLWFALYDPSLNLVGQSSDQGGSATWAASASKSLALGAAYMVPTTGVYYAAVMVNMGTGGSPAVPSLRGISTGGSTLSGALAGMTALCGTNGSALAATAPAGPITLTVGTSAPFVVAT